MTPAAKPRVSDERVARLTCPGNIVEVSLEEAREFPSLWRDLALDLRDARAEIARLNGQTHYDASAEEAARWRECAQALAGVVRPISNARRRIDTTKLMMLTLTNADRDAHGRQWGLTPDEMSDMVFMLNCAGDLRFALARFDAMEKGEPSAPSTVIADANAAILRLQKRLDAVRPVVKAAVEWERADAHADLYSAVSALPAADREWATKGE